MFFDKIYLLLKNSQENSLPKNLLPHDEMTKESCTSRFFLAPLLHEKFLLVSDFDFFIHL